MIRILRREIGRLVADRSGATVSIEFVLVVIPMVIMLVGTIEGSRLFWARNSLQYATEEAGRYAMTHVTATDTTLETYATDAFDGASYGTPAFDAVFDTAPDPDVVTITGTMTFDLNVLFLAFSIPLEGESTVPLID
jgi:Flp pilus assembly protein TadG